MSKTIKRLFLNNWNIAGLFFTCFCAHSALAQTTWNDLDLGSVPAGSHNLLGNGCTVTGAGIQIGGAADSGHLMYQNMTGSVEITAHVLSLPNSPTGATVGLMMRDSTLASGCSAYISVDYNGVLKFTTRTPAGNSSSNTITGPTQAAPIWLRMDRVMVSGSSSVSVFYSTDGNAWTQVGTTQTTSMASAILSGINVSSGSATLTAIATLDHLSQIPWSDVDLGDVLGGAHTIASNVYALTGSGLQIGGTADNGHFMFQNLNGNVEVTTRVVTLSSTPTTSSVGLMMRDTTNVNGCTAYLAVDASGALTFTTRASNGASTTTSSGPTQTLPVWLRMSRTMVSGSSSIVGYYSTNGSSWTQVGSQTTQMASNVLIGASICSGSATATSTATLDHLLAVANVPQLGSNLLVWLRADAGVTQTTSGTISSWADQSGNGNNATQSSASVQPVLATSDPYFNYQPEIYFNGSHGLSIANSTALNPSYVTIFAVCQAVGTTTALAVDKNGGGTTGYGLVVGGNGLIPKFVHNSNSANGTSLLNSYNLLEGDFDSVSYRIYVNGVPGAVVLSGTTLTTNTVNIGIGQDHNGGTNYMTGNIAEELIFNQGLNDSDRQHVEAYLFQKYGLGVPPTAPAPILGLGQGTYYGSQLVPISPAESGESVFYTTDTSDPSDATNPNRIMVTSTANIVIPSTTSTTTTTIKAIATEGGFANSPVITAIYTIDPTSNFTRTGLATWLRADIGVSVTSGSHITTWSDQSGQGNDATQAVSAQQPTLAPTSGPNGCATVNFSGSQGLSIADAATLDSAQATIFSVVNNTGTTTANLVDKNNGNSYALTVTSGTSAKFYRNSANVSTSVTTGSGIYHLLEGDYDQVSYRIYVDGGALVSTASTVALGTNTVNVGIGQAHNGGTYMTGNIAEELIFNRGLSDSERQHVEAYLYAKYIVGTHPPVTAAQLSVPAGTYTLPQQVNLVPGDAGQTIYYTTDGSDPSNPTNTQRIAVTSGATISVGVSMTIKTFTTQPGFANSPVTTTTYTIDSTSTFTRSGLVGWLRADVGVSTTSGGKVTGWADQSGSGNGNNATQANTSLQPTLTSSISAINNQSAITFNGSTGLSIANSTTLSPMTQATVFVVSNNSGAAAKLVDKDPSNTGFALTTTSGTNVTFTRNTTAFTGTVVSGGSYNLSEGYTKTSTATNLYINGTGGTPTAAGGFTANSAAIGIGESSSGTTSLNGNMAEVLIFNRPLTDLERHDVEAYLYNKYLVGTRPVAPAPVLGLGQGTYSSLLNVPLALGEAGETVYYTTDGSDPTDISNAGRIAVTQATTISVTGTTKIKVYATEPNFADSAVTTATYTIDSSSTFTRSGLVGWLRADVGFSATSGAISSWADQSGLGNDATQPNSSLQPTLTTGTINGQSAAIVHFNGSQGLGIGSTTALAGMNQASVFVVSNNPTGAAKLVDKSSSSTTGFALTATSVTNATLFRNSSTLTGTVSSSSYYLLEGVIPTSGAWYLYVNGTQAATASSGSFTANSSAIGIGESYAGVTSLNGNLAEVLIFSRALSTQERQDVEAYLDAKYGFTGVATANVPILSTVVTGGSQTVTITPGATGETVYYTTDGTDPTVSLTRLSTTTTTTVTVSTATIVKAVGDITGDAESATVATTEANPAPIGNDNQGGASAPPGVYAVMPASGPIAINAYTSNAMRMVVDLTTPAVGEIGLGWTRFNETRSVAGSEVLGVGGNWRHGFQWDLAYTTVNGTQAIEVVYPDGTTNLFYQTGANVWTSTSAVTDVITPNGTGFFLTNKGNQVYAFGQTAGGIYLLNSITDSMGNATALSYDSQNRLTQVQEPGGRFLSVYYTSYIAEYQYVGGAGWTTYATASYISSVVTSDGRSVTYAYTPIQDTSGNYRMEWNCLASATYSGGDVAAYTYAPLLAPGTPVLLTASDTRARSTVSDVSYTYYAGPSDALGAVQGTAAGTTTLVPVATVSLAGKNAQAPLVTFPDGAVYDYAVSAGGLLANVQNTLGAIQSYGYQTDGTSWTVTSTNAKGKTTTSTTDMSGKLLSRSWPKVSEATDPTEHWTYNTAGFLTSYQDAMGRTTLITRDPATNLVTRVDYADGTNETFTYNSYHEVLQHKRRGGGVEVFGYSTATGTAGLLLTEENAVGNVTTFGYDAYYRVAAITDAKGYTTNFWYDDKGRTVRIIHPDTTHRDFTYDKSNNVLTVTDERAKTWTFTYDSQSRLLTATDPLGRVTTYAYGSGSNTSPTLITLPGGKKIAATYNKAWGYKTATVTTASGVTGEAATTTYGFDTVGNVTTVTDPLGHVTTLNYDARNRVSSVTDAASNTGLFYYDAVGNLTETLDPASGETDNFYDAVNRLYYSSDPKGQITRMAYDAEDQLTKYIDPNSNTYQYTYDVAERQKTMQYPDSSVESYTYDPNGNLGAYKTRDNKTETLAYDTRNRTTGTSWNDGVTPSTTMAYDSASRLTTLNNVNSALTYAYDDDGEVLSEKQTVTGLDVAPGGKTVSYAYNTDSTLGTFTYPDTTALSYTYNNRNQTTAVIQGGSTHVADYTYDLAGNRKTKNLANGTGSTLSYDAVERLISIADLTPSPTAGTALQRFDYGYDTMSRRKYVKRDNALGDVYTYDTSGQITGVQYNATNPDTTPSSPLRTVSYALDAAGNRSGSSAVVDSVNGTTSYAANGNNQYTTVGGHAVSYDGKGNLSSYNGWSYTYNANNQLTYASNGASSVTFAYDALGRCVSRIDGGVTSYFVYDLGWNIIGDYNASGTQTTRYVGGTGVDEMLTKTDISSGTVVYYHTDGLGSVTKLTSSTGAVLEQYSYDIYGAPTIKNAAGTTISTTAYGNRFMFTGREYIASLALYDYRARAYSPELGRFLQPDPIGHAGDAYNIHRYCGNDPVNNIDPSGCDDGDLNSISYNMGGGYGGDDNGGTDNGSYGGGSGGANDGAIDNSNTSYAGTAGGGSGGSGGGGGKKTAPIDPTIGTPATISLTNPGGTTTVGAGKAPTVTGGLSISADQFYSSTIANDPSAAKFPGNYLNSFMINMSFWASQNLGSLIIARQSLDNGTTVLGFGSLTVGAIETITVKTGTLYSSQLVQQAQANAGRLAMTIQPGETYIGFMYADGRLIGNLTKPGQFMSHEVLASQLSVRGISGGLQPGVLAITVGKSSGGAINAFGSGSFGPLTDGQKAIARSLVK